MTLENVVKVNQIYAQKYKMLTHNYSCLNKIDCHALTLDGNVKIADVAKWGTWVSYIQIYYQ